MTNLCNRFTAAVAAGAFCILMLAAIAGAQEFRGTVTGAITDPNGAAVPGAVVSLKNTATNVTRTSTTGDDGSYAFQLIEPGVYNFSVTTNGFKTATREKVQVQVDDKLNIDFKLEIGTSAEVTVTTDSGVVETGSVSLGTLVSRRQIEELPLAEGAPYSLATQAPGMVYTGDPNFQGPTANGNLAGFRSNGTQGNQVNATGGNVINLDGSPNLAYDGQVAFTPPSDATQEFKVQTNTFDAQMGFTAGATVNVAIKSGTNQFHGSGYWFNRDKSRTANNFFNNRAGLPRPERKYNRYGAVIDGPIFKDKTFFLFSYERQNDNVAQTTTYSVPTDLMRQGNFSEILATTPIYNPNSAVLLNTTCTPGSTGTTVCRTPFAGNIIPQGQLYGPALAFMKYFPKANLPGTQNNYITDQNLHRPYRSYMFKLDHNINGSNRISGKYYHSANTEDRYNLTMEEGSIFQGYENRRNDGANVNWTSTLSSNWILDVRGSWNKFKLQRLQDGQPTAGELGFTGIPVARQSNIFPRFDFTNFMTVGSLRADYNDGRIRPFEMFTAQPTFTQIAGNHMLRYGYDYRRLHETFDYDGYASGRFQFQGTYTMPASNSSSTERDKVGRDLAAFLLGIPVASSSSLIDNPQRYDVASQYHGMFVQDDWRATSKLTLNLGLRYEVETGFNEANGQMVTDFSRTAPAPLRAAALANYNASVPAGVPIDAFQNLSGGFVFAYNSQTTNQRMDKNNWQPRIGASYAINSKTVLRGGFGIFTAPFQIITQNVIFQPGFSSPTLFSPTANNGLTFVATLANAFPNGIAPSQGSLQGLNTFVGRDLTSVGNNGPTSIILPNDRQNANYKRFIAGIQREIWGGVVVEATYVQSLGSNLAVNRELNAIPKQYLVDLSTTTASNVISTLATASTFLTQTVANPFRNLVPDVAAWNAATIARRRLLTPFPQFGNVSVTEYNGTSDFRSFQLQVTKRYAKGLSLNGSYTFTRERISNQYLNPQDTELTEQISPNERPNRFTFSGIYELPIGRGRTWGTNWNKVVDAIVGGWQVQGLYEWQSGEPLVFPNVWYNGDPSQLKSKMGQTDDQGRKYGVDIPAWDISGFYTTFATTGPQLASTVPGVANNYTSGSTVALRNFPLTLDGLRNQRFLKFDVGLSKNFRIREGMKFQLRVEAINLLNTPYFTSPTVNPATVATSTNGVVNYLGSFGYTNAPVRQPPRDIQIGGRFTF